jgi:hypothetical protein
MGAADVGGRHGDHIGARGHRPHLLPALLLPVFRAAGAHRRRAVHRADAFRAILGQCGGPCRRLRRGRGRGRTSSRRHSAAAARGSGVCWLGITREIEANLLSWWFAAALYTATLVYLLRYVFQHDVMTGDRLFGAAAAYLMIGVLWGYLYALVGHYYPGSFGVGGVATPLSTYDYRLLFATSTGFSDVTALTRASRCASSSR